MKIFEIVTSAYAVLFKDWRIYLRIAWFPALISLLFNLYSHYKFSSLVETLLTYDPSNPADLPIGLMLLAMALTLLTWLIIIPAATAWHRHVIGKATNQAQAVRYHLGAEEALYLIKVAQLLALLMGAYFVLIVIASFIGGGAGVFAGLVMLLLMVGFALVLPAAATGHNITFKRAFNLLAGQRAKAFVCFVVALVPLLSLALMMLLFLAPFFDAAGFVGLVFLAALDILVEYIVWGLSVALLSQIYLAVATKSP